jgi:hypothetical protein
VVGDFNENVDEWSSVGGRYPTALMPESSEGGSSETIHLTASTDRVLVTGDRVVLYDPWFGLPDGGRGSYVFRGTWQTLDHMLVGPGLLDGHGLEYETDSFIVFALDSTVDSGGFPIRDKRLDWRTSDHLPLLLRISPAGSQ